MQLKRLTLKNFRQFQDTSIEFASGHENITVVHGANGSGKTTLLNAFKWVLYDNVDFATRPDRLVTEGVIASATKGDEIETVVSLEFAHENDQYTVIRRATFEKRSTDDFDGEVLDSEVVLKRGTHGKAERVENADHLLNTIIPKRLSELFFFDGEDIDELAGVDNQEQIQEAIQNIMGLTILERATRHLDHVAGVFEDEFAEFGSDELSELVETKREIEEQNDKLQEKKQNKANEQDKLAEEIADIEAKLERFDDSKALQEQRASLIDERDGFEQEVVKLSEAIQSEILERGYAPVAMPLIRETAEELDDLREKGTIPSNLTDDFLDDLLENRRCICGRDLSADSDPYNQIASLRGEAPAEGVESAALRIIGQLRQFSEDRTEFGEQLEQHIEDRSDAQDEIDRLQQTIDKISAELSDIDVESAGGKTIQEWEGERKKHEQQKEDAIAAEARLEKTIEDNDEQIDQLEAEIRELREDRQEAVTARRRQRAAELVRDEISEKFDGLKQEIREVSNDEVQQTFGTVARKDLQVEITDEFKLKIYQDVTEGRVEVEKSTGERQIASLAFIGSLVKIARRRYESENDGEYFTGGIYPLVMDSPFGALDKEHRRKISRVLPELASQVVVFATDSQWDGPVEEEMSDAIGKQYWLDFDPGDHPDEHPQTRVEREPTKIPQ